MCSHGASSSGRGHASHTSSQLGVNSCNERISAHARAAQAVASISHVVLCPSASLQRSRSSRSDLVAARSITFSRCAWPKRRNKALSTLLHGRLLFRPDMYLLSTVHLFFSAYACSLSAPRSMRSGSTPLAQQKSQVTAPRNSRSSSSMSISHCHRSQTVYVHSQQHASSSSIRMISTPRAAGQTNQGASCSTVPPAGSCSGDE